MRDNYLLLCVEKRKQKKKDELTQKLLMNWNKKKKKSIENVNPYRKLLVRGAFNVIVKL